MSCPPPSSTHTPPSPLSVEDLDGLPSPPAVAGKILLAASNENADLSEIGALIESDPAMSLKVLRSANKAMHGRAGRTDSVQRAVNALGLTAIKSIALCLAVREAALFSADRAQRADPLSLTLWRHSLAVACAAQLLAERRKPALAERAFAAGLVHDCGRQALLALRPDEYGAILERDDLGMEEVLALETQTLALDHSLAGKRLLEAWGLPVSLVNAAWLHHLSFEALQAMGDAGELALYCAEADQLAHDLMGDRAVSGTTRRAAPRTPAAQAELQAVQSQLGWRFAERAELFDLEDDPALFYYRASQAAARRQVRISLELQESNARLSRMGQALEILSDASANFQSAQDDRELSRKTALALMGLGCAAGLVCLQESAPTTRTPQPGQVEPGATLAGTSWAALSEPGAEAVGSASKSDAQGRRLRPFHLRLNRQPDGQTTMSRDPSVDAALATLPKPVRIAFLLALSGRSGAATLAAAIGPGVEDRLICEPIPSETEDGQAPVGGDLVICSMPADWPEVEAKDAIRRLARRIGAERDRLKLLRNLREREEELVKALRQSEAAASRLLRTERLAAVGQLAAGAAHEINNPLAILYARAQLMRQSAFSAGDEETGRRLEQMMEQMERIQAVVKRLLDFARPTLPRVERIDLNQLAAKALDLVTPRLQAAAIEVSTGYDPRLPQVEADPAQIEQALVNVLLNAEHAVSERREKSPADFRGQLRLATKLDAALGKALIEIEDNGPGISRENLDKIFDPFFTTREQGRGSGLGLSQAHAALVAHGGDIRVNTAEGRGARFSLALPLLAPEN